MLKVGVAARRFGRSSVGPPEKRAGDGCERTEGRGHYVVCRCFFGE